MKKIIVALSLTLLFSVSSVTSVLAQPSQNGSLTEIGVSETSVEASAPRLNRTFDEDVLPANQQIGTHTYIDDDTLLWTDTITFTVDSDSDCAVNFKIMNSMGSIVYFQFDVEPGSSKTISVDTWVHYWFFIGHDKNTTQRLKGSFHD